MSNTDFVDDAGVTRLQGQLSPAPAAGGQSGAGSPLGVVVPASIGGQYTDTTNGELWLATGATNVDWISVGGVTGLAPGTSPGIQMLDAAVSVNGEGWGVMDSTGVAGFTVEDSTAGPTTTPVVSTSKNTLDDGVTGAATFAASIAVFGGAPPAVAPSVTGALTTVADAPAKDVLTSIIAALVAYGLATDGTT